jgi:hypothetical protein
MGDKEPISLNHDLKKTPPRAGTAVEGNRNFRTPSRTGFDVGPSIRILRVKMQEGYALEVKDSVGTLRNAGKLPQLAKYVLQIEKIFMASMTHASIPVRVNDEPRRADP